MKEIDIMKETLFSFDVETNGLWGKAFAIGGVVYDTESGKEITSFLARCPIIEELNSWVGENVLPQLKNVLITHNSYEELVKAFSKFYMQYKDSDIVVHMGMPVECRVLLDMHTMGFIGDWDAPYPLIDISAIPQISTSVDNYNKTHHIEIVDVEGATHNPLYDSRAAALAYLHINKK
jgi:hypothetical protein